MDKINALKLLQQDVPSNPLVWYLLGLEYMDMKDKNKALDSFSMCLKYCNDDLRMSVVEKLTMITSWTENNSKLDEQPNKQTKHSDIPEQSNIKTTTDDPTSKEPSTKILPFTLVPGGKQDHNDKRQDILFEDVGGLDELKDAIRMKIIKPFLTPGLFAKFKKKAGGGLLLYGPPGCGKTFIARATAGECNANFTPIHIIDILDPFIGVSEANLHNIISDSRMKKPSIVFIDEIDALGYQRSKTSSSHLRPLVDQLLSELDGIDTDNDQVLFIGATNTPWDVDPAFRRYGRFDKWVFVPPPDLEARKTIFNLKLKDKPIDDIDVDLLAANTHFYSGADIENVVELAAEEVLSEIFTTGIERLIKMDDLKKAISKITPSSIDWLNTVKNYVKYANQSGLYNDVKQYLSKNKFQI